MSAYPPVYGEPRKGLATASLVLGVLSILTLGCLGVGALTGLILGIIALTRANRSPAEYGGKGLAIGGIVTNALSVFLIVPMGIIAAIAIPSLLRARVSANESGTIGDIRTVISAQAAYQSVTGAYGTLECLNQPSACRPGYTGPTFIDSPLLLPVKSGYRRTFHPGLPVQPGDGSPAGLASFAYVAVPERAGQTGVRGFCGGTDGIICYTADGRAPEVVDGACQLSSCTELR
jgi:type IV pilus assembly protein PilA